MRINTALGQCTGAGPKNSSNSKRISDLINIDTHPHTHTHTAALSVNLLPKGHKSSFESTAVSDRHFIGTISKLMIGHPPNKTHTLSHTHTHTFTHPHKHTHTHTHTLPWCRL